MPIVSVDRPPGLFWEPKRKPKWHHTECDPFGRLRRGLLSAILFEPGAWHRDYVLPNRTFTPTGTPVYSNTQIGGAVNTNSGGYLTLASPVLTPGAWTVSVLMLLNGATQAVSTLFTMDGAGNTHFYLQGNTGPIPGAISMNGSNAQDSVFLAQNFTGWHRITVAATSQTGSGFVYLDGFNYGNAAIVTGTTSFTTFLGDAVHNGNNTIQMGDVFCWNRQLSDIEVMTHANDPYGTTLRPRFSRLARSPGLQSKRRPGLMTIGVGP